MRPRSNTTSAATLNPISVQSEQRNHAAPIITPRTSPAPHKSRRGSSRPSRLSNSNTPSSRKGAQPTARLCGLMICATGVQHSIRGRQRMRGLITHEIDELQYSACHRILGSCVHHLGKERRLLATQCVQNGRTSIDGLLATIADSFKPSMG